MPHKVFANNQLLTAAEVNTYLMRQANIIVANAAERDAIANPTQGMTVYRIDVGRQERYLAAWHAVNNPAGASVAGWYPARRIMVARRTVAQALSSGWNTMNGFNSVAARNDGLGVLGSGGQFTLTAAGWYRINASYFLTSGSNPVSIEITKNATGPNTAGSLAASFASGGNAAGIVVEAELAAGDVIRALIFASAANSLDQSGGSQRGSNLSIERLD